MDGLQLPHPFLKHGKGLLHHGTAAYTHWLGKQLPTEAEWERAARGMQGGQKFVFGDTLGPDRTNIAGLQATTPVGSYPPNSFGLYDLTASVWQWCRDWYEPDYYARLPSQNPKGPETGTQKVLRGGSWFHKDSWRVAVRGADEPSLLFRHRLPLRPRFKVTKREKNRSSGLIIRKKQEAHGLRTVGWQTTLLTHTFVCVKICVGGNSWQPICNLTIG